MRLGYFFLLASVREDAVLRSVADYLENWLGLDDDGIGTAAYYGQLEATDLPEAFAAVKQLVIVPGASHLFEEPGTLEHAAALARDWCVEHLLAAPVPLP